MQVNLADGAGATWAVGDSALFRPTSSVIVELDGLDETDDMRIFGQHGIYGGRRCIATWKFSSEELRAFMRCQDELALPWDDHWFCIYFPEPL